VRNNDEITYPVSLILFVPDCVKKSLRNATMRKFFALSGAKIIKALVNNLFRQCSLGIAE